MTNIFPIDFEEKLTMAQDDYILFSDSEDGNKIKKAQYSNLKGEKGDTGNTGPQGPQGIQGVQGEQGIQGAQGDAATITVGTVTTGAAGTSASVVNSGTQSAAVLDFTIPQGAKGDTGATGATGPQGTTGNGISSITSSKVGKTTTVTITETDGTVDTFTVEDGTDGQGAGDVVGPASSTDGDIVLFDGTTGKLIKDGSVALTDLATQTDLSSKQDTLSAGTNITISSNTISATDTTYTAGTGLALNGTEFSNSGVTSVNGSTGDVSVTEFSPSNAGSTSQVLTKTANGYEWSAPSGGDVVVSSQANNILTSGMKIWAGTETNYGNLGTYDQNTLYLTVE